MRITREIADAMEFAEVEGMGHCLNSARERFPELAPESITIGGGIAPFMGTNSPLSQAVGIGLRQPAGEAEADAFLTFYRDRGTSPRVRLSPNADWRFARALAARGCVPLSYENLMIADLSALDATRDDRVDSALDVNEWSDASELGFKDGAPSTEVERQVPLLLCSTPQVTALEIRVGGDVVATGCVDVNGEIAGLFGGSTIPSHRGQGLQTALIRDRIARARERGARFIRVTTRLGTISEQNVRRTGFVLLYTRTTWGMP
jgi:GNAT superfamily N-acetyltransferase